MDKKLFGYKFGRLRQQYGLSMHDVARQSNCSASLVYRTEKGLRIPKPQTLVKLADGFGISKYQMFAMAGLNPSYDVVYQQITDLAKKLSHDELRDLKQYTLALYRHKRPSERYTARKLAPITLGYV